MSRYRYDSLQAAIDTAESHVRCRRYADIVEQQLTELWTNYGDLAEIWAGFTTSTATPCAYEYCRSALFSGRFAMFSGRFALFKRFLRFPALRACVLRV